MISYYELKEFEVLSSFCDSFRINLKRNKSISDHNKKRYQMLIYFTKKLINHQELEISKIIKLKDEIKQSICVNKNWLLEKVDQLLIN